MAAKQGSGTAAMDVNRKLLIVDQDAQSRALKMQLLEQSGLQATAVETGREAPDSVSTEAPHDCRMMRAPA